MRIIAKNHDYYDSALAFGHDEHVVFERKEEEHVAEWKKPLPEGYSFMNPKLGTRAMMYEWRQGRRQGEYDNNPRGLEFSYNPFTVAFCGKLYPGIRLDHRKRNSLGEWKSDFSYTMDAYCELLHFHRLKFYEPVGKSRWHRQISYNEDRQGSPRKEQDCKEYFERFGEDHIAFFAEHRKPIVMYGQESYLDGGRTTLRFNGELKKVAFYKVFDAYTAFQELDMFISGVMSSPGVGAPSKVKPKRPNPVGISDEDLRDKKGFDDMSFKKAPTKRR